VIRPLISVLDNDRRRRAMHARVTTLQLDPSRLDDVRRQLEQDQVPEFEQLDGFKGFTMLGDRSSGKAIGVSFWESEDAMRSSEEAVTPGRQRAAEEGGASGEPQVERFEVLLDTMA
jgi:heme-degrading monooxygenase HmoA